MMFGGLLNREGRGQMPSFNDKLSDEQIAALAS
jgi:mono/diheme cytochrome c family protein